MRRITCSPDVEPPSRDRATVASRRRILSAGGLGVVGLAGAALAPAACAAHDSRTARRLVTPADQERRGNPGRGDFGTLPITWSVRTSAPVIALTFDDGPDPAFTPRVLDALKRHGAKATFFMMGWNCSRHPDLARRVVAEGHEIGNHTWTHQDLAHLDPSAALDEIRRGREAIETVTGTEVTLFRPPRGELTGVALRYAAEQRQRILMWTRNGGLRELTTPDVVAADLVGAVAPGFIVDLHDGIGRGTFEPRARFARDLAAHRNVEVEALDAILGPLTERGLRCVTASELLALPEDRQPIVDPAEVAEWDDDGPVQSRRT